MLRAVWAMFRSHCAAVYASFSLASMLVALKPVCLDTVRSRGNDTYELLNFDDILNIQHTVSLREVDNLTTVQASFRLLACQCEARVALRRSLETRPDFQYEA
jgi:hypothetical protein